jgi:hypothetical protein
VKRAAGDLSAETAAASAAYGVLIRLFPAQQDLLDAVLVTSLAPIPDGPAKAAGQVFGDAVAEAIVLRSGNGILAPGPACTPGTEPGDTMLRRWTLGKASSRPSNSRGASCRMAAGLVERPPHHGGPIRNRSASS